MIRIRVNGRVNVKGIVRVRDICVSVKLCLGYV